MVFYIPLLLGWIEMKTLLYDYLDFYVPNSIFIYLFYILYICSLKIFDNPLILHV